MPAPESTPLAVHVRRIYSEYLEMPGLRLTGVQAQRLLGLQPGTCAEALQVLIDAGFLRRTEAGEYVRLTDGVIAAITRQRADAGALRRTAAAARARASRSA